MKNGVKRIEDELLVRRGRPPRLAELVHDLPGAVINGAEPALWAAVEAVARAADHGAAAAAQPAYHNNHHVAEAVLAMAWLCADAMARSCLSGRDALLAIAAMAGHDFGHDGSLAGGGVLERQARDATCAIAAAAGMAGDDLAMVDQLIMSTQPKLVHANVARLRQNAGDVASMLRVFANEADIFASFLPLLGPRLTEALARERAAAGNGTMLANLARHRLRFLRSYPQASPSGVRLGLEVARDCCFRAYEEVARLAGTGHTPKAGTEVLDRLTPADAQTIYTAAVVRSDYGDP